ncbi:hypothetical protein DPMN_171969 [Dreissena polymorpha]|uniref:Uncharacterized protein n=1 Tax=Dreissena polymorpha TaxID=45954 RepID=A0A9D4IFM2_DREPO|nr:hypothetical protein DPMN_171969 [Dreissena polymorpha]
MEKPSTSTSSPTSESSTYSIHDPPGYIKPSLQDMLLTDVNADELLTIAKILRVDYLGPAAFPCSFPQSGLIHGNNKRLMVSLSCRREGKNSKAINIIFLIDTGSPNTFLSDKAMEALVGKADCYMSGPMAVMIHTKKVIVCYLSPHDKHFSDVNVLGMDFLSDNMLSLFINYGQKSFELTMI